jgi:RNA polymerase sigma-70 factor, ECF subfamily
MELIEPEFAPSTWNSFCLLVLKELPAADVAETLGLSVNAVLIAKSRVLRRLRQEGRGLID